MLLPDRDQDPVMVMTEGAFMHNKAPLGKASSRRLAGDWAGYLYVK